MSLYEQVLTFLTLSGTMLGILLLYVFYRVDFNPKNFTRYWHHSEGNKPIWKGILFILGVPALVGIILFYANQAQAEDYKYFDHATVFMGLDRTMNQSPFCEQEGIDNKITSNLGFTQSVVTKGHFDLSAKYTHHSCAINPDSDNSYDAFGVVVEWKIY